MSLFAELKRRNVFRVAAAYLALGWIATQVTSTVAPMLHLPEWIGPVVLWAGAVGFPFVVMFAWMYEVTPEGIRKEAEVDRTQSITHFTARRLDFLIVGLLIVAIGLFALDRVYPRRGPTESSPPAAATTATPSVEDKSIAVLPFADMSQARDQEYFSDGISEELLNLLAQVPDLHVASRTSSFAFKGKGVGIQEIARQLHVTHVLEGSVRKSGNTVRVTAQLIRAEDGFHVWSQTWDRELSDIFAVQDEIAAAVVGQMKVTLLGPAPKSRVTDPQAYALFLQARALGLQFTAQGLQQSTDLLQQVVQIDPDYVEAWRLLARDSLNRARLGLQSPDEAYDLARGYLDRALAIDANYGRGHDGLAMIALYYDRDFAVAAREWSRALELDPGNVAILGNATGLLRALGRAEQAVEVQEHVILRDPANTVEYLLLAWAYYYSGRPDESAKAFRTTLNLTPGHLEAESGVALALLRAGDKEGALAAANSASSERLRLAAQSVVYYALGQKAKSDAALAELIDKYERSSPQAIADAYAYRGENDRAFQWLDKAARYRDWAMSFAAVDPMLESLHDDPRWLPFLRKHGMAPEQLAAIEFDVPIPK